MKTKLTAIQKAWKFKGFLNSNDINEVLTATNEVVKIYKDHEEEVKQKCKVQNFENVNGIDFNVWAYTQENRINDLYNDLKSKYHDLHFDKYQFNTY
jgi:hypothetical protein